MNNNPIDQEKLMDAIISSSGGKIDRNTISSAAGGNLSSLMSSLNESDRQKLQKALSDKNALKQLLSSDAAKKILNNLSNGGKR